MIPVEPSLDRSIWEADCVSLSGGLTAMLACRRKDGAESEGGQPRGDILVVSAAPL
jgi:hypothetical protein